MLTACGEAAGGDGGTAIVRDSAGIRIVENSDPVWSEARAWRIGSAPLLEIGMLEGPPEYLLDGVSGARRLADGTVLVANGGSRELRFYDPRGSHLRSVGRQGEGPGEYRSISWIGPYRGDSLLVYDFQALRLSVLSAGGEYGRAVTFPLLPDGGLAAPTAAFSDGSLSARRTATYTAGEVTTGMHHSEATYLRLSGETGELMDTIARSPDQSRYVLAEPGMMSVTMPLLGPQTFREVAGDSLFLGYSGRHQIDIYGNDGVLRTILRRDAEPAPVTPEDLARLRDERLSSIEDEAARQRMARVLDAMPTPQERPAYAGLRVDDAGNLWVREQSLPDEPERWTVFDSTGQLLGTLQLPDEFRPLHIGDDFLLGVTEDEFGVERVRMYALEKP